MTGDIIRCMVAIYGQKSDGWIYDWRQALLSAGIPCALVGPPFGFAALADRLIFVLFSSKNDASSIAFQKSLPLEKTLDISPDTSPEALVDFVKLRFFQKFKYDFEYAEGYGIRFTEKRAYFGGHELHLTKTEYRIVRLLFHARGEYFSPEEIIAACFERKGSTVTTHVSNINQKARYMTEMPLIETRRYHGYRIPTPVVSSLN